eukprot:scaffold1131_cov161-Amphora_coffeaeformis.AAC.1
MIKGKTFERLIVATASHDACESIGGWSIGGCATFCKHAQLFGEDHLFGSQTGDWVMCDKKACHQKYRQDSPNPYSMQSAGFEPAHTNILRPERLHSVDA